MQAPSGPQHRHTANDLQIWRIIEVSTADETNSAVQASVVSSSNSSGVGIVGGSSAMALSAVKLQQQHNQTQPSSSTLVDDASPFDKHEYIFNYDPLDASSTTITTTKPNSSQNHIASVRPNRPSHLLRMRSVPVDNVAEKHSLSLVRYAPFRRIAVADIVANAYDRTENPVSRKDAASPVVAAAAVLNLPPVRRRRSITMCGDLRRPANVETSDSEMNMTVASAQTTSTAQLTHDDYQVLRMETQLLIEQERRAEASSRATARLQIQQQQQHTQQLEMQQFKKVRQRRRRRSRSTSYDRQSAADGGDGSLEMERRRLHQKYSRSWSALAEAQAQEVRLSDAPKGTFS